MQQTGGSNLLIQQSNTPMFWNQKNLSRFGDRGFQGNVPATTKTSYGVLARRSRQYMHRQVPVVRDYPDLSMPHRPITQADDPRQLASQGQLTKYAGAGTHGAVG